MKHISMKSRLLATTLIAGAAFAAPAIAQEAETDEEARQTAVVVVGSRIVRQDFTSNSPVATIGSEQFELSNVVNTEGLLNTLPQAVPGLDRTSNNPGNGTATVDLRGLGPQRTMVLVNGKRMVPTSGSGVVDINSIPSSLIERVEVLTGGASAVYGSDAISGVVNFVLKDNFEGVEAFAGYEVTEEGDADIWSTGLTLGGNFDNDRGNAVVSMSYTSRSDLFQGDRDFSTFAQFDDGEGGLYDGGSSGIPATSIFSGSVGAGTNSDCASSGVMFETSGDIRCFIDSGASNDFYNYSPVNYIQLPQERFQATGMATYDINENVEVYGRFMYALNEVPQQLAATPIFQSGSEFSLDGNPFLSANSQAILSGDNVDQVGFGGRVDPIFSDGGDVFTETNTCTNCLFDASFVDQNNDGIDDDMRFDTTAIIDTDGDGIADTATAFLRRRMLEVGERVSDDQFSAVQFTAGIRGALSENFDYDISYQEGRVLNSSAQRGNVSRSNFLQSLLLADADGDGNVDVDINGDPTCADPSGGCVPMNLFGQGNISAAAAEYLAVRVNSDARYNQSIINAGITGDTSGFFELPGGPIGLAGGIEYRDESFSFDPSQDLATGNIAGFNGAPPVEGGFDVYDVYAETYLPFITDAPWAKVLGLELAYRLSDYSTSGSVDAYKIGGEWAPNEQLRFRTSLNTAVRAPNVVELFSPVNEGFPSATDYCAGDAPNASAISAICQATGVPASLVGSPALNLASGQVRQLSGGNIDLQPEEAETFTIGFVTTPDFVPGLTVAMDYFDIKIDDAISAFGGGASNILNLCYNDATVGGIGSEFCNSIQRRSDGTIDFVSAQSKNVASIGLEGVDLQIDYRLDTEMGAFGIAYMGTHTESSTFEAFAGAAVDECAGEFGSLVCGEPIPAYKHRITGSWADGPFSAQLLWRMVGSVDDDDDGEVYAVESIDAFHYFDLSGSWQVNDSFTLTGGIDNVANEKPPILGDNQEQANTYPATYDVFGRTFFLRAKVNF